MVSDIGDCCHDYADNKIWGLAIQLTNQGQLL